MYTSKG